MGMALLHQAAVSVGTYWRGKLCCGVLGGARSFSAHRGRRVAGATRGIPCRHEHSLFCSELLAPLNITVMHKQSVTPKLHASNLHMCIASDGKCKGMCWLTCFCGVYSSIVTIVMRYWHQRADERHVTLPQGNQELLVVRDKVGRPPGELVVSKSMECDIFPFSALTLLVGQ